MVLHLTVNEDCGGSSPSSPVNPKSIGEKSEGMVLAKFLQKGWIVLLPFGDNQRYDFVIDRGNGFERIQVKTGRLKGGCITASTCSSQIHRGKGTKGYRGDCDYFAIYIPSLNKTYFISVDECPEGQVYLRIQEAKNRQTSGIKWAKDYEI